MDDIIEETGRLDTLYNNFCNAKVEAEKEEIFAEVQDVVSDIIEKINELERELEEVRKSTIDTKINIIRRW